MQASSREQPFCPQCQAPISQTGGQCPFCGAEVLDRSPNIKDLPGAQLHAATSPSVRPPRARPQRPAEKWSATTGVVIGALLGVLAILIGTIVVYSKFSKRVVHEEVVDQSTELPSSEPSHPVILGVTLVKGMNVDPTDILQATRERVAEKKNINDVRLLGIFARGASNAKVNLEEEKASVSFQFLVIHRDVRANKAEDRRAERVEMTFQRNSPQTNRMDLSASTRTVPEPVCIWSAAWNAAIASGLPTDERMDVSYALDPAQNKGVWTFTTQGQPMLTRLIDGQTCAIKVQRK